jgi:hypothetical protein
MVVGWVEFYGVGVLETSKAEALKCEHFDGTGHVVSRSTRAEAVTPLLNQWVLSRNLRRLYNEDGRKFLTNTFSVADHTICTPVQAHIYEHAFKSRGINQGHAHRNKASAQNIYPSQA